MFLFVVPGFVDLLIIAAILFLLVGVPIVVVVIVLLVLKRSQAPGADKRTTHDAGPN